MTQRVFIKVVGFSDVERHALNTVFRLSEGRDVTYSPWAPDAPDKPKLALASLPIADEAATAAEALELMRSNEYKVALIDFSLPDTEGWSFLKQLTGGERPIPHVIVTKHGATIGERIRGHFAGLDALFRKPPDPERL